MKTNKEIIQDLTKYFMNQPQEHTCKLLACMMIDVNRMYNAHKLAEDERNNLMLRVQWNIDQLNSFIKNGPNGDLKMENLDSNDN